MSESKKTDFSGKRLLILGGTAASADLVKNAREMGVYTIVTDEMQADVGQAKIAADEGASVSTTDIEGLAALIREKKIDGVFTGPGEFNLRNLIRLCEHTGLPCYTSTEVWNHCANKDWFKSYCREYGVDCTREFEVSEDSADEELALLPYPVIVKPVDGSSSAGISVCTEASQVREACRKARAVSGRKKIIVEKYIDNGGQIFSVRYLLHDGEAYPYFAMDTYVVDPVNRKYLISGCTVAPSRYADYYFREMDPKVRKMLKGMGLREGTAFIQSLPCDGKIYFHEMGYRLSGGMIYKLTEPLNGVNDMKHMIAYALGGSLYSDADLQVISMDFKKTAVQLMIPLLPGTIGRIEGLNELLQLKELRDFIQYYDVGDTVETAVLGTLGQHFGRFTLILNSKAEVPGMIRKIQQTLRVTGTDGRQMNALPFDTDRLC